jgi:hypothetical protein
MVDRKVVPFDEFYYQLKLMHLFQKHLYKYRNQPIREISDEDIVQQRQGPEKNFF